MDCERREERKVHVKLESHQMFVVDENHRKLTTTKDRTPSVVGRVCKVCVLLK